MVLELLRNGFTWHLVYLPSIPDSVFAAGQLVQPVAA